MFNLILKAHLQRKMNTKNKKGLTLLELLAVIVIIAVVAGIAAPTVMNYIGDSEVKSFKGELKTLESVMQQVTAKSTVIDYTKVDGATPNSFSNLKGYIDSTQGLPKRSGVNELNEAAIKIVVSKTATGYTAYYGLGATAPSTTNYLPESLAKDLGRLILTSEGTTANSRTITAWPIDIELLYEAKLLNNTLSFPKELPTDSAQRTSAGYGDRFQNRNSSNAGTPRIKSFASATAKNEIGNYLLLDNSRVIYTGTDAITSSGEVIHMSDNKN